MSVKETKEKLLELPDEIFNLETDLIKVVENREKLKKEACAIEADYYSVVSNTKDKDGKSKYSNEASRKAEQASRLQGNPAYLELKKKGSTLDVNIQKLKLEVEHRKRLFSAWKKIADLMSVIELDKEIAGEK